MIKIPFYLLLSFFIGIFADASVFAFTNTKESDNSQIKCTELKEITINGLVRTNRRTFEGKLESLKKQKQILSDDVSLLIKDIYLLGNYENVEGILTPNCFLILNIQEKPIVSKITFDGNKKIDSENLSTEMLTKEKQPLAMNNLFFDFQRLKAVYSKSGFLDSSFDIYKKQNKKDNSKAEIFVKINEGKSGKISKIIINGNKFFHKSQLVDVIAIREYSMFKFLSSKSRYDEQTVALSADSLRKLYLEHGFVDFKTNGIVSTFDSKNTKFNVYINLTEGDRYKINDVKINGGIKETEKIAADKDVIKMIARLKKLKFYQEDEVSKLKQKLESKLAASGYTLAVVEKSIIRGGFEKTKYSWQESLRLADVVFNIKDADKIYINKIRITGNVKTNDNVIRREIMLSEGDLYNGDLIRQSTQNIRYLGYIKNVEVEEIPVDGSKNLINLQFKVEEGSTGSINFSAGYSSLDKAIAMIGYNQQNILGRGYDGSINVEKSYYRQTFATSITNPRMFNTFLLGGLSFASMKTDSYQIQNFRQESNSGAFSLGYNLSQKLRHMWSYAYRDDRILNSSSSTIDPTIAENYGVFQTSLISHSLIYDKRNNQLIPTSGFLFKFNQSYAGIGGNISYLSNELLVSQHVDLYKEDFVFSVLFKAGYIKGMGGKTVNIKDRFYFGMTEMRGFDFNGIGPRGATLNSNGSIAGYSQIGLRGNEYQYLSFEQTFPNFIPKDLGFRTYLFYDIGRVYSIDTVVDSSTGYAIVDSRAFRQSYGFGLAWQSPMGIIGFDYGIAKKYEAFDQKRSFRLNIGAQRYVL